MIGAPEVKKFQLWLSWAYVDKPLKDAFLDDLLPALGSFSDVRFTWWEDSHLTPGEELLPGILDRLDEGDFGVLLLSGRYFGRPFIRKHELRRFAGPEVDKPAIPVRLAPMLDPSADPDLGGVEDLVQFARAGKSFAELSGVKRRQFALDCATAIRRRALNLNGYRPL